MVAGPITYANAGQILTDRPQPKAVAWALHTDMLDTCHNAATQWIEEATHEVIW